MVAAQSLVAVFAIGWLVCAARSFHVALDARHVQSLQHQFTVLELPRARCPDVGGSSGVANDGGWAWDPRCAHGLTRQIECKYNGFQYSMEWYFMQVLRDSPQYLASRPEDARFVYFPQCVSEVYFALRASFNMTHWAAISAAEAEYLIPLLRWAHGSELHQRHGGRNFWTVFSMDLGRQDFPRSAAWLEQWSVGSLTGSEQWLQNSGVLLTEPTGFGLASCWEEDTVPVTVANDMFPARNFREHDTVISIPSRFAPDVSSRRFGGRPTLVFFHGSPNSCARRRVLELYTNAPGFDVSTGILTDREYRRRLWRSRFCLVMRGSSHTNNVRLYEVIAHGCVPVIVSDDFQPPLDAWLPWRDIAIFLPTSSIPSLGNIFRHKVNESRRWNFFVNVALGTGEQESAHAAEIWTQSKDGLDRRTMWSKLSVARVFDWDRSDFWILFLADVKKKLSIRMQCFHGNSGSCMSRGPDVVMSPPAGSFYWRRHDWEYVSLIGQRIDPTATSTSTASPALASLLLPALRWLYDLIHRRDERIPGAIVECGTVSTNETKRWLKAFVGHLGRPARGKFNATRRVCAGRGEAGTAMVSLEPSLWKLSALQRVAASRGWASFGWQGVHGELTTVGPSTESEGVGDAELVDSTSRVTSPGASSKTQEFVFLTPAAILRLAMAASPVRVSPRVFVLRVSPRCRQAACTMLFGLGVSAARSERLPLVKFVLLARPMGPRGSFACTADTLASRAGWLCFHPLRGGGLRPAFGPFTLGDADLPGDLFCGREDDRDLDLIVQMLNGADVGTGVPPTRWGAFLEGRGADERLLALPSTSLGRFLYTATIERRANTRT